MPESCLEKTVVGAWWEFAGSLNVVVKAPEVLHCCHCDNWPLVLLPCSRFVILGTVFK